MKKIDKTEEDKELQKKNNILRDYYLSKKDKFGIKMETVSCFSNAEALTFKICINFVVFRLKVLVSKCISTSSAQYSHKS